MSTSRIPDASQLRSGVTVVDIVAREMYADIRLLRNSPSRDSARADWTLALSDQEREQWREQAIGFVNALLYSGVHVDWADR